MIILLDVFFVFRISKAFFNARSFPTRGEGTLDARLRMSAGEAKTTLALLCFCDTRALRARRDYKPRGSPGASRVITLLTKPMKRRNTDCRRFQKRRDWIRKRLKFTVKIIFFGATIGSKNHALQEYLSNGLGTADQPLMGFTVSFILQ